MSSDGDVMQIVRGTSRHWNAARFVSGGHSVPAHTFVKLTLLIKQTQSGQRINMLDFSDYDLTPCSPVGVACLAYSSTLEMEALRSSAWRRVASQKTVPYFSKNREMKTVKRKGK
jgi:hypothetical protein